MLKIESDRLFGENVSFSLPVGFYLEEYMRDDLQLVSVDGATEIKIKFQKSILATEELFDNFIEDTGAIQIGKHINIKRGKGTATAVYCEYEDRQIYLERVTFKANKYGENAILIIIETLGKTVYEILDSSSVKAFIKSIEYF